ncbi:unconventional prefoldin RPB5 interactor-like isoform X2 [Dreissena polymorpha]|uniref:unconventional prefoldin RPB5 interactor-like isoform X2 n=1 Tax=Dreissena polymorpha TaxID=45954 RepID=UPI0022656098|nr:unconventional prefoldin RPB5 interactor-like isoform X2 [Dreissena polymorpha]
MFSQMASNQYQEQLNRLQVEQNNAISNTKLQIDKWVSFKTDYSALRERLRTLPDNLSHDVMVPIGKMAFMPGQLVHTNEILVLLGDNWFVERSAKQAADIVTRRIESIDKQLEDLNKQLGLLQPRLDFTTELEGMSRDREVQDIREEYDEEKEKTWKVQHKKNVQAYRHKLKAEAEQSNTPVTTKDNTDADLWQRLDQLEEIESRRHELAKIGTNAESKLESQQLPDWVPSSSTHNEEQPLAYQRREDGSWESLQQQNQIVPVPANQQETTEDQEDSESDVLDSDDDELDDEDEIEVEEYSESDDEDDEADVCRGKGQIIQFSHTLIQPQEGNSEDQLTPGNIYRRMYRPKSILKKSPPQKRLTKKKSTNHSRVSFDTESDEDRVHKNLATSDMQLKNRPAFTSAVLERQTTEQFKLPSGAAEHGTTNTHSSESTVTQFLNENSDSVKSVTDQFASVSVSVPSSQANTKPVSRFKAQRLNKS